jgi:hypothetical protein
MANVFGFKVTIPIFICFSGCQVHKDSRAAPPERTTVCSSATPKLQPSGGTARRRRRFTRVTVHHYLNSGGHRTEEAKINSIRRLGLRIRTDHSGLNLLPAPNN